MIEFWKKLDLKSPMGLATNFIVQFQAIFIF